MVKNRKISKAEVVKAALEVLKTTSIDDLTTRRVAEQLDSSVQPIFYNFESMDELKQVARQTIYNFYQQCMLEGAQNEPAYRGMGLAYIKFAQNYPNYFKILFMSHTNLDPNLVISRDDQTNRILEAGMRMTGFDPETQRQFHLKVWIFTHGLATLVATQTIEISDQEIERLLTETVWAMAIGQGDKPSDELLKKRQRSFSRFGLRNHQNKMEQNDEA